MLWCLGLSGMPLATYIAHIYTAAEHGAGAGGGRISTNIDRPSEAEALRSERFPAVRPVVCMREVGLGDLNRPLLGG